MKCGVECVISSEPCGDNQLEVTVMRSLNRRFISFVVRRVGYTGRRGKPLGKEKKSFKVCSDRLMQNKTPAIVEKYASVSCEGLRGHSLIVKDSCSAALPRKHDASICPARGLSSLSAVPFSPSRLCSQPNDSARASSINPRFFAPPSLQD